MIDLDEREQQIDETLRASGLRLRSATVTARVPELRKRRQSHRRGWLVGLVTAAVVVVGLVAIGTNRNQPAANDPARLRWIVTDLPTGWKASGAVDPEGTPDTGLQPTLSNLYATDSAPGGPVLLVQGSNGNVDSPIEPGMAFQPETGFRETTIADRRAAFASGLGGLRTLYVEVDNKWIRLSSRNLTDEALARLAKSVAWAGPGIASIPTASLSDGLRLVVPANATLDPMFLSRPGHGVAEARYLGSADGTHSMALAVTRPRVAARAMLELSRDMKPAAIGSTPGLESALALPWSPPITERTLYWEHEGLAFYLVGQQVTQADLMAAARSIRMATPAEWAALTAASSSASGVTEGTSPVGSEAPGTGVEAPADTIPPFDGQARDIEVEVAVENRSDNEQIWSGTLPTGETWRATVSRVYDSGSISAEINGVSSGGTFGFRTSSIASTSDLQPFGFALTRNQRAVWMGLSRSNGDRYAVKLRDLPGTDGIRIAVLPLPPESPGQSVELLDAAGAVVEHLP